MKVIYAGFPKTGTKTMNAALTELGFNCYDYLENYQFLGSEWMRIFEEGGTTEDFKRMYKDVDACMDVPCCYFWEEIHKAFPDAKIIFGQRKDDEEWWRSMRSQIIKNQPMKVIGVLSPSCYFMNNYGSVMCRVMFGCYYPLSWFGTDLGNEILFRKAYRKHNTNVLKNAPKDKLFIINFEEGWEPLCEFLKVPVPDVPFPHKNKNASITEEWLKSNPLLQRMQREYLTSASILTCLSAFALYKLVTKRAAVLSAANFATNCLIKKLSVD